jgi:hypothetical protein
MWGPCLRTNLMPSLTVRGLASPDDGVQHAIVNIATERTFDRFEVGLVTVRGDLHSVRQPTREIINLLGVFAGCGYARVAARRRARRFS